jgi:hypothetical protein
VLPAVAVTVYPPPSITTLFEETIKQVDVAELSETLWVSVYIPAEASSPQVEIFPGERIAEKACGAKRKIRAKIIPLKIFVILLLCEIIFENIYLLYYIFCSPLPSVLLVDTVVGITEQKN